MYLVWKHHEPSRKNTCIHNFKKLDLNTASVNTEQ